MTIWDGGGNDTYDLSNYAQRISRSTCVPANGRRPRRPSSPISAHGHIARGNVANALLFKGDTRSLIENAIGGSATTDVIIANQAANRLTGGGGADTFHWMASTRRRARRAGRHASPISLRGTDRIDLSSIDAIPATGGTIDDFAFIGTERVQQRRRPAPLSGRGPQPPRPGATSTATASPTWRSS